MAVLAGLPAGRPRITRQAAALGVALALHGALVVAFGERAHPAAGRATVPGPGGAPGPAVLWLHPLPAPAAAQASPVAPAAHQDGTAAPTPEPAAAAGSVPALEGSLSRHGALWSLAFPDAELPARQVELSLKLVLDGGRQVQGAEPSGPAPEAIVQYVLGQLLGAVVDAAAAPGAEVCLWLRFDADAARVEWRLVPPPARAGRACARPAGV